MLRIKSGDTGQTRQEAISAYLADEATARVILPGDVLLQRGGEFVVVSKTVDSQHYQEWEVVEIFDTMMTGAPHES